VHMDKPGNIKQIVYIYGMMVWSHGDNTKAPNTMYRVARAVCHSVRAGGGVNRLGSISPGGNPGSTSDLLSFRTRLPIANNIEHPASGFRVNVIGFCGLASAGSRFGTYDPGFGPVLLTFSPRHAATETKKPF